MASLQLVGNLPHLESLVWDDVEEDPDTASVTPPLKESRHAVLAGGMNTMCGVNCGSRVWCLCGDIAGTGGCVDDNCGDVNEDGGVDDDGDGIELADEEPGGGNVADADAIDFVDREPVVIDSYEDPGWNEW